MATLKHINSKNADYGAAEQYLLFEHDEFTMKPVLDETGRLIPREDYRLSTLNCDGEDFAVACMRANLRYQKNQRREDVKSHHYIISFDPRDGPDNGLTVDRAQALGEQFCKEHFPGHQALVCTHPDGHNHSGNIHVHIVINSLRIEEVPFPTLKSLKAENNEAHEGGKAGEEKSSEAVSDQSGFFTPNDKIDFSNVKIEPLFEEEVDFDTFSKSDFRAVKVKECSAVPKSKKLLKFVLDDGTGTDRIILSGIHAYYEPEELVGKTLIAITNLPPRKMMGIASCGMLLSAVNNKKDSDEEELHLLMVDNHIPAGAKLY